MVHLTVVSQLFFSTRWVKFYISSRSLCLATKKCATSNCVILAKQQNLIGCRLQSRIFYGRQQNWIFEGKRRFFHCWKLCGRQFDCQNLCRGKCFWLIWAFSLAKLVVNCAIFLRKEKRWSGWRRRKSSALVRMSVSKKIDDVAQPPMPGDQNKREVSEGDASKKHV